MAGNTPLDSTLEVTQWERDYFAEYVRSNQFAEYTGTGSSNIVVVNERLSNNPGDNVVIPLVGALTGAGVTGSTTLEGSEEELGNYGHTIKCDYLRNAVSVTKAVQAQSAIDILEAGREQLMAWSMDSLRDRVITALGSKSGQADDTWAANNSDRLLYGASVGHDSGDYSVDLAKLSAADDKLTTDTLSLLKRVARAASPKIRPFRIRDNMREEWYVAFCASRAFRDFKASLQASSGDGLFRIYTTGDNHPLARDGDIIFDGVVVREVPEIATLTGVGLAGINIDPVYLCGAQAVGFGVKQRTRAIFETSDYGMVRGVGVEENTGVEKIQGDFGTQVDHGVCTGFFSGVADA